MSGRYHPVRLLDLAMVVAGYCLLVLARLPGLVGGGRSAIWGAADGDALGLIWTLWHTAHHLLTQGRLGVHTDLILFPHGGVIFPANPLEAVLLAPVTHWLGPVLTFNLTQVLHVGLAAGFTYALVVAITGHRLAALAVSPSLALSSVLLCTAHNGNNEVGQLFWLPLAGWALWRAIHRPGVGATVLAGLGLGLAFVANIYVGLGAGVTALWVAGAAPLSRQRWRPLALVSILAVLVAGPVLLYQGSVLRDGASVVEKSRETVFRQRALEGAAGLAGCVQPGTRRVPDPRGGSTPFLNGWAVGWLLLALALPRLRRMRRLDRACWVGALAGVFLALGPVLKLAAVPVVAGGRFFPLPYIFLDRLPPFSILIELWRFSAVVQVALAVLAARTLIRWRSPVAVVAGALLVVESMWLTPGAAVWRVDMFPDEPVATILDGLTPGPVLSFPVRQGDWPLYYQTQHGQPVANSPMNAGDPAVFGLIAGGTWAPEDLRRIAYDVGYRWLLLHMRPDTRDEQPMDELLQLLHEQGLVVRQMGDLALVELRAGPPWPLQHLESRNLP